MHPALYYAYRNCDCHAPSVKPQTFKAPALLTCIQWFDNQFLIHAKEA